MDIKLTATYQPQGKKLWDCWFIDDDDGRHHVFYLQADDSLAPDDRHDHAEIGHAVSADYLHWQELGVVLSAGTSVSWDDLAIWTGSVQHGPDGLWHMLYTARSRRQPTLQQIGHLVSNDLLDWQKRSVDRPVLSPGYPYDARMMINDRGTFPAFRDPFVYEGTTGYNMLLTARTATDNPYNACIARAISSDMQQWRLQDPLLAPDRYDEMECPQLVEYGGYWYLFFNVWAKHYAPYWQRQCGGAWSGLHAYYATTADGPFVAVNGNAVVLDNGESLYDARILPDGSNRVIGWIGSQGDEPFVGALCAPVNLAISKDRISVLQ